MKLQKDLREFIELLNSTKVKYLLVGGHAVAFHGFPRFTGDIDFFIENSADNVQRVQTALVQFGFPAVAQDLSNPISPGTVIQLGRPPHRIDLLVSISGVSFEDAWDSLQFAPIDGFDIPVINKQLLLQNKRASGRPKDLEDVRQLEGE
jgi:hypothetical protein